MFSVYFTDANTGWAVGEVGTILKTSDGGTTWSPQTSGTPNGLTSVYFTDANTGWAVARGTILKTTDGGTTWSPQTSGTTSLLFSVYFTDANTGWIAGSGTILKTINGGTAWSSQTSGTTNTLRSVYFTDGDNGWVVGGNGTILKTMTGGVTSIKEFHYSNTEGPKTITLFQNYPNPFNPLTTIEYHLKQNAEIELSIYNLVGQKVINPVNQNQLAGTHSINWNGLDENGLPVSSGMYIYQLKSNGRLIKSRKMILLK